MLHGWIVFVVGAPALLWHRHSQLRSGTPAHRIRLEVAFGLYVLVLVVVVLFPLRVDPGLRADDAVWDYAAFLKNWVNLTPLATVRQLLARSSATQAIRQLGGNLLLLAPFGMLVPMRWPRMRRIVPFVLALCATAAGIECMQYLARVARLSLRSIDVDDVILNVMGGLVGYLATLVFLLLASRVATAPVQALQEDAE